MPLKALLCEKYNFDINVPLKDESNIDKHKQSYLHFITSRKDLVSAKCLATDWLFENCFDKEYNIIEYFAGVGLTSTILQNRLNVKEHKVIEIDKNCYLQLKANKQLTATLEDGHKAILKNHQSDIKICDWPHCSIIHLKRGKWSNFFALFVSKPDIVCWTDTSMTYSIKIHGLPPPPPPVVEI